jgi:Lysine-specific metallo-endopeptidase
MDRFSQAYEAARTALDTADFSASLEKHRAALKSLMAAGGPEATQSEVLGKLRLLLKSEAWSLVGQGGQGGPADASAKAILNSAGKAASGRSQRAATVKMLKHFHHVDSKGGQALWVYAPPKVYSKWIFDELDGADEARMLAALKKTEDEVYTESQRATMSAALQMARKLCLDAAAKLGSSPSDATLGVLDRYFTNAATTDDARKAVIETLRAGYIRIAAACSASTVIISDEPTDRVGGGWKDWAFIYPSEAMKVIYLQGAWLAKADEVKPSNETPLYRCARTIIHELSHKELRTEDVVYGPSGLMPEGSATLTPEHALHNADSWAYFAVDVNGFLNGPDAQNGRKACLNIRAVPTRTLTLA